MSKKILLLLSIAAVGVVVACGKSEAPISPSSAVSSADALPDGSTLKIDAPRLISPTNGVQIQRGNTFTVTLENVKGRYATFPVSYELEVRNSATGAIVATATFPAAPGATTSFAVSAANLAFETNHSWRVRAAYLQGRGPWSANGTFVSGKKAFLNPQASQAFDPLTEGFTVGQQKGGQFIPGVGWQAGARDAGIDYDIATCISCRVEFDVTNVSEGEGTCCNADMKFLSMGDANTFGDFNAFRDHDWKMHLVQRADGDGTGLEIIWRNGGTDPGGDNPGDHRIKMTCCGPDFKDSSVFHFVVEWNPSGYNISVGTNGGPQVQYLADGFGGIPYGPPNHRVSLGCYPRQETIPGAIYRNVSITPR